MKYGHNKQNKQFKISQYAAAAMRCKMNEGVHQQNKRNVAADSYYALPATESKNNNFQNRNTQTPSRGEHFQIAKYMNYGHNKQFKVLQYTAAAVPMKVRTNERKNNAADYSYYALLATESMNNNF